MKTILTSVFMLIVLTACTAPQISSPKGTQGTPESATTDIHQPNMPNPASVYCTEQGNKLEIRTADDGSTCDEWAYCRGECEPVTPVVSVEATATPSNNPGSDMPPGATEGTVDWWGVIKSTDPGAQYDDNFERQDTGQVIYFGIDSMDPAIKS